MTSKYQYFGTKRGLYHAFVFLRHSLYHNIEATRMILNCGGVQVERKTYEFEDLCKVLAACVKRALLDAKRGDERALMWLDTFYPEWRKYGA